MPLTGCGGEQTASPSALTFMLEVILFTDCALRVQATGEIPMSFYTLTWSILAGAVILGLIAVAWVMHLQKQSRRLRERFGPEYIRAIYDLGSRAKAETELKAREGRGEHLILTPPLN